MFLCVIICYKKIQNLIENFFFSFTDYFLIIIYFLSLSLVLHFSIFKTDEKRFFKYEYKLIYTGKRTNCCDKAVF